MSEPTFRVRLITELQYFSDGKCNVIKSYSMPLKLDKVKKKPKVIAPVEGDSVEL